jgi:hypothetical protein
MCLVSELTPKATLQYDKSVLVMSDAIKSTQNHLASGHFNWERSSLPNSVQFLFQHCHLQSSFGQV